MQVSVLEIGFIGHLRNKLLIKTTLNYSNVCDVYTADP